MRIAIVACLAASVAAAQADVVPRAGLVITSSARIRPGTYDLAAPGDTARAVIVVRGSGIDVDFSGVALHGAPLSANPDAGAGIAIRVEGGENVTIRGARIRGYRIAILARGTRNLRLIDNDLSHNWKPRLYSIVEHESLADWLSFHQNEKDEWMRHGAALYLTDVRGGEIRGNTVRQGMNGLMITRTDSLLIWNNDFSFNSGVGIGLYRSDRNRIMHNRVDYNVRGYSEGFYKRGQDSAGILIYQQSDSNFVAFNSVTHGGDGLFLWAGQHTMDTGEGGANDNEIFRNDFSWAPTNGIEATFSRNKFILNRVVGSDHGVWGGYSFGSLIFNNTFARNRIGVAIEHGQDNTIEQNTFDGDSTAIWLWANTIEPSDWGYPKHRDTRSRDYTVHNNQIRGSRVAFRVADTHGLRVNRNDVTADTVFAIRGDTSNVWFEPKRDRTTTVVDRWELFGDRSLTGGNQVLPSIYANWPRSTIIVDEWGPHDWTTPKLWPVDSSLSTPLRLRVLGPALPVPGGMESQVPRQRWQVRFWPNADVSKREGVVGDTIVITPRPGPVEDWRIGIGIEGSSTIAWYSRFDPKARWDVKVFAWTDSATHPIQHPLAFGDLLRGVRVPPVFSTSTNRLDYVWYRPPARVQGWPQERAGVVATTRVNLPAGNYAIRTISDDGIRVFVDGKLVHEDWSIHESRVHEAPLSGGAHDIRVEYFQRDGWTELRAEVIKR